VQITLKEEYTTFELEEFLREYNNALRKMNISAKVRIKDHPVDNSYSIKVPKEIIEEAIELVKTLSEDNQ